MKYSFSYEGTAF